MQRAPAPSLHPALLPPGTEVGAWRVVAWAGRSVYGAVYRAVPVGQEQAEPVALKLALLPRDPRFVREAELLSRLCHPSIPRLRDSGHWQPPSGTPHPFFAMEWVDGLPLYDWARLHPPAAWQVFQLLAQLARALESIHAQGAVHRDVKGDNILVRRTDGRAMLMDLGSCRYPGVSTLTPQMLIPGTPAYHSPEAWLFPLQFGRDATARYSAGPADDLFALGVTACRLLTGAYPELSEPRKDAAGIWRLKAGVLPPARMGELEVEPRLRTLILRMLSVHPEERGTAAELAEALEQAGEETAPQSSQTHVAVKPLLPSTEVEKQIASAGDSATSASPQAFTQRWRPQFVTAAVCLSLIMWTWWMTPGESVEQPSVVQQEMSADTGQADGGPVGLGEAVSATSTVDPDKVSSPQALAEDTPPEPLPGQTRPDAKGRCPRKQQVALNGGCWVVLDRERCEALGGEMFKGTCYVPVLLPGRQPTSNPGSQP